MKLSIIWRGYDGNESVNNLPRPWGMNNKQITQACYKSLIKAVKNLDYEVHIIGDCLSEETKNLILSITPSEKIKSKFFTNEPLKAIGSCSKAIEIADTIDKDRWIFFLESDYLFDWENYANRLVDFVDGFLENSKLALPVFIHDLDYPDNYHRLLSRCYLFQTPTGYVREVPSCTFTFMCHANTYNKFREHIRKSFKEQSDWNLSTIFKKEALIFSVLPATINHCHLGVMSNYINWEKFIKG